MLCLPLFAGAVNFPGNGNAGFGNPIGSSTLAVTDDGTTITFVVTKGSSSMNDALVLYIDSKSGGFSSTAGFADANDGLRSAISGFDGGTNRSTLTFSGTFQPDFAIAIKPTAPENFGGLWALANGGANSLTYITSANLSPTGTATSSTYTFTATKANLGITGAGINFSFVASLISATGYRSDESIGIAQAAGNPGYADVTASSSYQYPSGLLPIKLTGFTGDLRNGQVSLAWKTAQEHNLQGFDVEQSIDGRAWSKVGSVAGANNTIGADYHFNIQNMTQSFVLYRLKIIDRDGKFDYSGQVSIKTKGQSNFELIGNPIKETIRLAIHQPQAETFTAKLISLNGKVVSNYLYQHTGGSSTLQIPVSTVTSGMYILQLASTNTMQSFKVMIP